MSVRRITIDYDKVTFEFSGMPDTASELDVKLVEGKTPLSVPGGAWYKLTIPLPPPQVPIDKWLAAANKRLEGLDKKLGFRPEIVLNENNNPTVICHIQEGERIVDEVTEDG